MNILVLIGAAFLVLVAKHVHALPIAEEAAGAETDGNAHKISKRSGFGFPRFPGFPGQGFPRLPFGNQFYPRQPFFPQIPVANNQQIQTSQIVIGGNNRPYGNSLYPGNAYNRFPSVGNFYPNYNRGYNYGGPY